MRTLSVTIQSEYEGKTVENVLKTELEMGRCRISRLKQSPTGMLLNGKPVYTTARVKKGDILTAEIGDNPLKKQANPVPMPLDVLFEDEDLLILNKPAGISTNVTKFPDEVTMEHVVAAYLGDELVGHPVNRLDKGTTGIMTFAKNGYIHELLRRRMHTDEYVREYEGIAVGHVEPGKGIIDLPIGFFDGSSMKRCIRPDGAPSKTGYEVLEYNGTY